ncbi:hypothetical protein M5689_003287 [Euphorbia peplus]|nr:hypothetical protein M5689_003287 [Euphorbia peplus]
MWIDTSWDETQCLKWYLFVKRGENNQLPRFQGGLLDRVGFWLDRAGHSEVTESSARSSKPLPRSSRAMNSVLDRASLWLDRAGQVFDRDTSLYGSSSILTRTL